MTLFEQFFAEFTKACAKLYLAFMPWALVVYVLAVPIELSRGIDVRRLLNFFAKIFILILLTVNAHRLMNSGGLVVENFIKRSGLVSPEKTAEAYKERLAAALGDDTIMEGGFLSLLFSSHFFDGLIYGTLFLVSVAVLLIITFITLVQKACLLVCWSVCPVLFAILALEPLAHLGVAHLMRCIAIILWPLGFCIAATFSDALLQMAIHLRVLPSTSVVSSLAGAIETLLIVAAIGFWNVYSTLKAPGFIHKFLVGHEGVAQRIPQAVSTLGSAAVFVGTAVVGGATFAVTSLIARWRGNSERQPTNSTQTPEFSSLPPMIPPDPAPAAFSSLAQSDPTGAEELKHLVNDP